MARRQSSSKKSSKKTEQPTGCRGCVSTILGIAVIIIVIVISLLTGIDPNEILDMILGTAPAPSTGGGAVVNTVTGEWWHLYFTEPVNSNDPARQVNGIDQYLVQAIDGASQTIDIAAFEMNLDSVTDALVRARQRGVQVRMVTDDESGVEDTETTIDRLVDAGIPVVDDRRNPYMHDKFVIIDGEQVWTGSWNFTRNGTFRNNNNAIAITSPALADIYTRKFDKMFENKQFGGSSPSSAGSVVINDTPIQVYFAPEDKVGDKIAALIEGARKSVRFMAFSFTHDKIGAALNEQASDGVKVEGIFEERGSGTEYSELTYLYCQNLPVRVDGNPRVFHHKVFIIDDETVITGSFNFSKNADTSNDENVLIIQDAEIAAQYNAEFDRRWAEAKAPQDISCR
ncbi:MAG: phospholipase [Anaerolineae bacterium]|nr:phospholipase [Anaerolineae bacterium]